MELFGMNIWKSGPHKIEYEKELKIGGHITEERWEKPEEYGDRKKDMVTLRILGKSHTFVLPWSGGKVDRQIGLFFN